MKKLNLDEYGFFVRHTCRTSAPPFILVNERLGYETLSPLMDEKTQPG